MRATRRHTATLIVLRTLLFALPQLPLTRVPAQVIKPQALSAYVNPMVGTGGDPDDGIDLFPGAVRPFGMVQLSPDTEEHGFGYHPIQTRIKGFSMTHMSGVGCANEGDVFFTATTGPIATQATMAKGIPARAGSGWAIAFGEGSSSRRRSPSMQPAENAQHASAIHAGPIQGVS